MNAKKHALIAASVAGLMAAGTAAMVQSAQAADAGKKVPCYGINKCKGTGDCGSKLMGNSCAGKNACKGQGFVELSKEDCLRINGGRLTEAKS